jgi:TusA-related sulfurtransferase
MPARFKTTLRINVPKGRNSKHRAIIVRILSELEGLKDGSALEIPLKDLPDSKEKIRSALSRASEKAGLKVATSSDETRLFIWNVSE